MRNETKVERSMLLYFDSCGPEVNMRSAIEGLYARFDDTRSTPVGMRCFAKYLAAFLHKYDCRDVTVLSGILMLWDEFNPYHRSIISGWMRGAQRLSSRSAILGDTSSDSSSVIHYPELTYYAIQGGRNYELLRVLVKYGLCAQPVEQEHITGDFVYALQSWSSLQHIFCWNGSYCDFDMIGFVEKYKPGANKLKLRNFLVFWTINMAISHFSITNERARALRVRVYDATEEVILKKRKCLDLLVESTTQPFVAECDVRQFFHHFFDYPETDAFLEAVCASFRTLFSQSRERLQPRSLLDLSRCRVRDCIRKSSTTLPQQVSKLPIPVLLKNFILFNH